MMEDMKRILKFYLPYALIVGAILTIAGMSMAATRAPQAYQKWEKFDQQMYRYSIYDGWLVRYGSNSIAFVPDKTHEWKVRPTR